MSFLFGRGDADRPAQRTRWIGSLTMDCDFDGHEKEVLSDKTISPLLSVRATRLGCSVSKWAKLLSVTTSKQGYV
jgi:hypothetical protein